MDWELVRLPVDRMPLNIHQTNIRGVACDSKNETFVEQETIEELNEEQYSDEVNEAVETLIKHLPFTNDTNSDMKVIKLQRNSGSKVVILVW